MKHGRLFNHWVNHDLKNFRPDFYKSLLEKDQVDVWEFIEEKYISRYKFMMRVDFDFSSSGLWKINYPGSVADDGMINPEDFNIPKNVGDEIQAWNEYVDKKIEPWPGGKEPDWDEVNKMGLEAAKKLKLAIGNDYYVEFNKFHELAIRNNEVIELPIPDKILKCGV